MFRFSREFALNEGKGLPRATKRERFEKKSASSRQSAWRWQRARQATGRAAPIASCPIPQIVSRAVVSTEIVDIFKASGIQSPDISILSDEFLAEVRDTDKKNLALEALRKLINGEVRSQSGKNIVQSRAFSERLKAAIAWYHSNAITTVEV
jgi:type I site-specific restriction-modification system R (restriction) subunit